MDIIDRIMEVLCPSGQLIPFGLTHVGRSGVTKISLPAGTDLDKIFNQFSDEELEKVKEIEQNDQRVVLVVY